MRKLALVLALLMLVGACPSVASAQAAAYAQSPILDEAVSSGELPPVEERLPDEPKLLHEILDEYVDLEIGNYGGTLHGVTTRPELLREVLHRTKRRSFVDVLRQLRRDHRQHPSGVRRERGFHRIYAPSPQRP